MRAIEHLDHRSPEYRRAYNRGWRSAVNALEGGALERADSRNETHAWYDGYMDGAAGREKWHLRDCPAHHNNEGGCGEA